MNTTDLLGFLAAIFTTVSFLPQAIQTIKTKNTAGISLIMYALFTMGIILWLVYGVLSNNYPVIFANAITTILSTIILGYKIKYK